jgi:hypothetical protein
MPAKTRKQQQFMAICSHSPEKAKGKCPPKAVAQEFSYMKGNKRKTNNHKGYTKE